jgi:DNA polymerase-3 subunit gamma/tau
MALNCPQRSPEGEPCGECDSCLRIWGGQTALDVVEIDAASNRGVDDARDLRERAMYAPSEEGRFKVYILDEAHMLTREAWNALLKILEEPPPRVIFIFATTEPQKIQQSASPILSRCQRFDFRRIGVVDITRRLEEVLAGEGTEAPQEALRTIARRADGGLRDGLSLLDQVLALTGGEISQEAVRRVLGLVEDERFFELLDILREDRHGDVFVFVEKLLDEGYDMAEFHRGLIETFRMLLRVKVSGGGDGLDLREDQLQAYQERAESFSVGDLVRMLAQATELEASGNLRRSAHPRLLLEMLLLRMSYQDRTISLESLLEGLGGGEFDRGGPPESSGPPQSGLSERSSGKNRPPQAPGKTDKGQAPHASVRHRSDEPQPPEDLPSAWRRLLEGGLGIPRGVVPFLRAASVDFPGGDRVALAVPEGPALERLLDPGVQKALKNALKELGQTVQEIDVAPVADSERFSGRITEETVRDSRLQELVEKEPALGEAVKELDLELLD